MFVWYCYMLFKSKGVLCISALQAVEKLLPLIQASTGEEKCALSAEAKVYLQRAEELAAIDEKKLPPLRPSYSPASTVPSSASTVSTLRATAQESEFPLQQYPLGTMQMCTSNVLQLPHPI